MRRHIRTICFVLVLTASAAFAGDQAADTAFLRLLLSEVQAGTMASEHYCTLVFANRHYHFEKANRKMGKDRDRKVYEGELSDADWKALTDALDNKEVRELNLAEVVSPMVIEDAHTFTISIRRETKFQNMEFLDNKSRKPYEKQLKPLLDWWKTFRNSRTDESSASTDSRCGLDSTHPVFSH